MKKIFTFLSLVFITINLNGQNNDNEPKRIWIIGDIPEYTPAYIDELNEIPDLIISTISSQTTLPY